MSTITREWLQQAINDYESVRDELPFGLDDYQGNILAALRIALASLESVAAPVVPDEMPAHIGPREFGRPQAYIDGWNACRAAMLQSGNFRENKNSSTNYPVIPSEVLSAILKVAKIRADFDDFDGDRRGIGDCLDEAEQELIVTINKYASQLAAEPIATNDVREQTAVPPVPVIQADVEQAIEKLKRKLVECNRYNYCADAVKGVEYACHAAMLQGAEPVQDWIPCSERMPEKYDFDIWVFSPTSGVSDGVQWDGCVFTDDEYQFMVNDATHWMRKAYPAAPQQEDL